MPKLRKRTNRYDQLQALLYGQLRLHGTKPEDLLGGEAPAGHRPHAGRRPARAREKA